MVCVCKSQKDQIKMNLAVGNERRNRVVKWVFMLLAFVGSVPVRQKSSETISGNWPRESWGKRLRERLQDPLFRKNAHILIVDLTHSD